MTEKINREVMLAYFEGFDSLHHKYFNDEADSEDFALREEIAGCFGVKNQQGHEIQEVTEIFRTIDKVYHYGSDENSREMNLLEQVTDKFLVQYVDIDGMKELFRPSFFHFEWMMHLEYVQKKHDYSYYRDHYLHQIRNLYEMLFLLQEKGLWRDCMEIYRQRRNTVANRMAESVEGQKKALSGESAGLLSRSFGDPDEWCYHYIIFSTAIVSALVHDIGYPITYMKRNLGTLQDFLPLSNLFMGLDDGIPRIKSLLGSSLLFETVDNNEIVRKLREDDHGAYSAIILLCQYYDNGKIFSLEPAKRMIIELSALVIYNHTLRHHFQNEKKYDRYQNVFTDNPISYLFRLCDDMQEWERVYFEITGKGTFFICDKCKKPMIRSRNKSHYYEPKDKEGRMDECQYEYECGCGAKGINTTTFPYRRLMNVAPFTELILEDDYKAPGDTSNAKGEKAAAGKKPVRREEQRWTLELKCNKGVLLQLARYNPDFAVQRARGIRELRGLTRGQAMLPHLFVSTFVSNNPVAIKTEILNEFIKRNPAIQMQIASVLENRSIKDAYGEKEFCESWRDIIGGIRRMPIEDIRGQIADIFRKEYCKMHRTDKGGNAEQKDPAEAEDLAWIPNTSIGFYLFLLIFCNIVNKVAFESDAGRDTDVRKKREAYELALNARFTEYGNRIAAEWEISDPELTVLIADCIVCMYGNISADDFFEGRNSFRYDLRIPLRTDLREILKKYTREPENTASGGQKYDYYSDYYFFYIMDYLNMHI